MHNDTDDMQRYPNTEKRGSLDHDEQQDIETDDEAGAADYNGSPDDDEQRYIETWETRSLEGDEESDLSTDSPDDQDLAIHGAVVSG